MKQRKVPIRSCVGCGARKPKRELIRVVRMPDGQVVVDPTGKKSGRGAYICASGSCLMEAVKSARLSKALEVDMPPDLVEQLQARVMEVAKGGGQNV
ncbi:MAG: RNase P modulator RnpM [Bacillota bacterium]